MNLQVTHTLQLFLHPLSKSLCFSASSSLDSSPKCGSTVAVEGSSQTLFNTFLSINLMQRRDIIPLTAVVCRLWRGSNSPMEFLAARCLLFVSWRSLCQQPLWITLWSFLICEEEEEGEREIQLVLLLLHRIAADCTGVPNKLVSQWKHGQSLIALWPQASRRCVQTFFSVTICKWH